MKREIIRVEPLSTYLERWKAPHVGRFLPGGECGVRPVFPFGSASQNFCKCAGVAGAF